jgi:hypothetical protein
VPIAALAAREARAMKCTICGKSSLPGSALCGPCKAALKRARYVTVQEDRVRSSVRDARRPSARAKVSSRHATVAASVTAPTPGLVPASAPAAVRTTSGRLFFCGLAVAAIGGIAYFGQHELIAGATAEKAVALAPLDVPPRRADMASAPSAPPLSVPVASSAPIAVTGGPTASVPAATPANAPANAPAKPLVPKGTANARADRRVVALFVPPASTPSAELSDAPAPESEKPVVAAPAAPPPDRWQSMGDALAQCDREGMFRGIVCGQRVRIQYCDGFWGKVAQCQGALTGDDLRR